MIRYDVIPGPRVGAWRVAVLKAVRVEGEAGPRHRAFRAGLGAVAVFLLRGDEVGARDPAGRPLDLTVLEDLYPDLRAELMAQE